MKLKALIPALILLGLLMVLGTSSTTLAQQTPYSQVNLPHAGLLAAMLTTSSSSTHGLTISAALPSAIMGESYKATFTVSGGTAPYRFTVATGQLPPGILLTPTTGTISGIPIKAGSFTFTISAADQESQSGTHSFQITVAKAPAVVVTVSPATASMLSAGTLQFSALVGNTSNATVTWSASTGTISNAGLYQAPMVSGNTTATVTATSAADPTKSATASVTITPPPLHLTTTSLSSATAGVTYSNPLSASGGTPPYTWALISGALPAGIALQSTGSLSGTSAQAGQFNFTVQLSDSSSPKLTASQPFTLTVNGPLPPATFFGFSESDTNGTNWPAVTYQMQRFWDSPGLQWPSLNTASGVFDFTSLDADLALALSTVLRKTCTHSPALRPGRLQSLRCNLQLHDRQRRRSWRMRSPQRPQERWQRNQCHLEGVDYGDCDPCQQPSVPQTHAHIKYWEIWNEPDTKAFFAGSIAQLARLTEDANCIITGRGVIHENGNGSATPCTAIRDRSRSADRDGLGARQNRGPRNMDRTNCIATTLPQYRVSVALSRIPRTRSPRRSTSSTSI